LLVLAALYYATRLSRVVLFWAAFILTRPLVATDGDFLDKPFGQGGLEVSRPLASLAIAVAMVALILVIPQRAGHHPGNGTAPRRRRRCAAQSRWRRCSCRR